MRPLAFFMTIALMSCSCSHISVDKGDEVLYVMPFERNGDVLILHLTGQVNEASMDALINGIDMADQDMNIHYILVEINSEGGNIDAGIRGAKALERAATPLGCVVDGEADSMAFYLLQSCPIRMMTKRSQVMLHNPILVAQGRFVNNPRELLAWADRFRVLERGMAEHYAARMKVTPDEIMKIFQERAGQWWMDWKEAEKMGGVDRVLASYKDAVDELKLLTPALPQFSAPDAGSPASEEKPSESPATE